MRMQTDPKKSKLIVYNENTRGPCKGGLGRKMATRLHLF